MSVHGRRVVMLGSAAVLTAVLSFGLGATVLSKRYTKVIVLDRRAEAMDIPRELMVGAEDALVTVVEASDFECRFCRKLQPVMEQLRREQADRVRYAFVPYPRGRGVHKDIYGRAYVAATFQEKGDEFRAALFDRKPRSRAAEEDRRVREAEVLVRDVAKRIGLDMVRFTEDMKADAIRMILAKAVEEIDRAGLEATPTVYVGGSPLRGALGPAAYRMAVESVAGK